MIGLRSMPKGPVSMRVFRGAVFERASHNIMPDKKHIRAYKMLLSKSWAKILKRQLGRSKRFYDAYRNEGVFGGGSGQRMTRNSMGLASGQLRKSITAMTKVFVEIDPANGRAFVDYQVIAKYEKWGDYISDGRRAAYIPYWALANWIRLKATQGSLQFGKIPERLSFSDKRNIGKSEQEILDSRKDRDAKIMAFAVAISRKAAKKRKPPVIKDWNNYFENEKLREMFHKEVDHKAHLIRQRMRRNIVKNIANGKQ